jgi:ankyrin repeat protein
VATPEELAVSQELSNRALPTAVNQPRAAAFVAVSLLTPALVLQVATSEEIAVIQAFQLHTAYDPHGWTALHHAAAAHKVQLVQQLLDIGADPAAADVMYGLTPLHLACMGRVLRSPQLFDLLDARQTATRLQVCDVM